MPVEPAIAQLLRQVVVLEIDTQTSPVRARGFNVRFSPQLQQMVEVRRGAELLWLNLCGVQREFGVQLDLDRSRIAELELVVDLKSLFEGELGAGAGCNLAAAEQSHPSDQILLCVDLARLNMSTPGLNLRMRGLHIEIAKHGSSGSADVAGSIAAMLQQVVNTCQQQLKQMYAQLWPGFVSGIISDVIISGLAVDVSGLEVALDCRQEALPGSKFNCEFRTSVDHMRLRHDRFFGRHLDRYTKLQKQDMTAALQYHLQHLPFNIEVEKLECKVGRLVQLQLCGLGMEVMQDHWLHYDIKGALGALEIEIGSERHKCVYMEATDAPLVLFQFCNIMDRIPGNNESLLQCYQQGSENIVGKDPGRLEFAQLQQEYAELKKTLQDELAQHTTTSDRIFELRHQIELLRYAQVRYFEQKFWLFSHIEMKTRLIVRLDERAIADALLILGEYSMSWLAEETSIRALQVRDGTLDAGQWDHILSEVAALGVAKDGSGTISDAEWESVVGKCECGDSSGLPGEQLHDVVLQTKILQSDLVHLADALAAEGRHAEFEQVQQGLDMMRSNPTLPQIEIFAKRLHDLGSSQLGTQVLKAGRHLVAQMVQEMPRPIGVQVDLDLQLPVIQWEGGDMEIQATLGKFYALSPAKTTSSGQKHSAHKWCSSTFEAKASGASVVVRDLAAENLSIWEGLELLHMPAALLLYGSWKLRRGAIRLLPWTLLSLSVEVWALNSQGDACSCKEPLALGLSAEARAVLARSFGLIYSRVRGVIESHEFIAGVSRKQLHRLAEVLIFKDMLMRWVLPGASNADDVETVSLIVRAHCRCALLVTSETGDVNVYEQIKQIITVPHTLHETMKERIEKQGLSENCRCCVVSLLSAEDLELWLSPDDFYARCQGVRLGVNVAGLRKAMNSLNLWDTIGLKFDMLDEIPSDLADGAYVVIEAPSPDQQLPQTSTGEFIAAVTAKPVMQFGFVDGVLATVPSMRITLPVQHKEMLDVDLEVVRVRLSGLIASFICDKYLSSSVLSAGNPMTAELARYSTKQSLGMEANHIATGDHSCREDQSVQSLAKWLQSLGSEAYSQKSNCDIIEAIKAVEALAVTKGRILATQTQRQALWCTSLSVGSLTLTGHVTPVERAAWLWLYATDAEVPLLASTRTLTDARKDLHLLENLIRNELDSATTRQIKRTMERITAGAIDYHTLGLANCTVLMSLSSRCLKIARAA